MIVHYVIHGQTACLGHRLNVDWPNDQKWSGEWKDVNCPTCLLGKAEVKTYTLAPQGTWIKCLRCKRTSYNRKDVEQRYCGCCKAHHDDIPKPFRAAWLKKLDIGSVPS